jgi:hypothetical protein
MLDCAPRYVGCRAVTEIFAGHVSMGNSVMLETRLASNPISGLIVGSYLDSRWCGSREAIDGARRTNLVPVGWMTDG